jgi:hypothetical protein
VKWPFFIDLLRGFRQARHQIKRPAEEQVWWLNFLWASDGSKHPVSVSTKPAAVHHAKIMI